VQVPRAVDINGERLRLDNLEATFGEPDAVHIVKHQKADTKGTVFADATGAFSLGRKCRDLVPCLL
jgi:hypothetical protein